MVKYLYLYQVCICIDIVFSVVVVSNSTALPTVRYNLRRGKGIICPTGCRLWLRVLSYSFDMNKMYSNIYQNGANHYFGLIDLLANVKRGTIKSHFCSCMVLLKRVYSWTTSIKHWIMAYHSFTLCFVYWTSVVHFYTVEPQLCSHSIQSVHLRLNSHCLSNQYWPSTSYWPANSFQITARQALIAGNHSHQYHHLDQAHLMRSQHSRKYSKNWINPNKIKSMPNKQETITISPRHHPLLVKS